MIGGASVNDHMASVERQLGRSLRRRAPALPEEGVRLWGYWLELHRRRSSGFGCDPLSFREVEAWSRLTGEALLPGDARAIMEIDDIFLEAQAKAAA